jgi:uncharacterized RDD family membrane protein YckC
MPATKCRYCGAHNPEGEERCIKCQRRLVLAGSVDLRYNAPVLSSAAAPALAVEAAPAPETRRQLEVAPPAPGPARPTQTPLFAYHETPKLVQEGQKPSSPRPQRRPVERKPIADEPATEPLGDRRQRARAPKMAEGQEAFRFVPPPPSKPFSREMDRSQSYPVALRGVRASAALLELGFILLFCAAFVGSVRTTLGQLPVGTSLAPYWLIALGVIALIYKLGWCLFLREAPGLRLAGLRVVSFDGHPPSRAQRVVRLFAGCLSLAAGGMGLLWALGDQEQLTWHDHISQTFVTAAPPIPPAHY